MSVIFLYHYFDKSVGPFVNLSDIPIDEAKTILKRIKELKPKSQCAIRDPEYIEHRHTCEGIVKNEFIKKGGIIRRESPHYMVIEHSPWLSTWFENCSFIKISIDEFDLNTVSFTYGDSMPTFSPRKISDKEYFHNVYTYEEILNLIMKYGLPQNWNDDGKFGYERYIEAHIWCDDTISHYMVSSCVKRDC